MTVEELPELETEVAVSGSAKQQDVAGPWCVVLGVGILLGSL
jgi:hypothetical protein